jgi:3-isopropylmalate dehydrogenase
MLIALFPGDGIGPEVIAEARRVLDALDLPGLTYEEGLVGGAAYKAKGHPLPPETLDIAERCNAILFGAVGDFDCDNLERHLRPEQAILGLRKALGLFANLRPATLFKELADASALRPEVATPDRHGDRARTEWRRLFWRKGHAHHRRRETRRL